MVVMLTTCSFAQNQNSTVETPSTEISRSTPVPLSEEKKAELQNKISLIDSQLAAIVGKRNHILKDPELVKKANESGWFEDMKTTEANLNEKKKALQDRLNRGY